MASDTSTAWSLHRFDLALSSPFRIAYDTVTHSHNALVTVRRADQVGFGEAGPVPTINGEDQERAISGLEAWLDGGAATGPEGLPPSARRVRDALGIAGSLAAETALTDLAAREAGEPLCTFLTGARPRAVETSITVPILPADEAEVRARDRLRDGYQIFKVKAGAGIDDDIERIARVREVVGTREIRVDPNQGWSRDEAKAAIPKLADLGVAVLEQPLAKDDLAGHAGLRGAGIPIMLDESVFGADDARRAIEAGACDRINIKLQKAGGLRAALDVADVAEAAGLPCMLGCMIESRVGILAGAHVVAAHGNIEWADLDGFTFLASDPVHGGASIEDGAVRLDRSAGLGVDDVDVGDALFSRTYEPAAV